MPGQQGGRTGIRRAALRLSCLLFASVIYLQPKSPAEMSVGLAAEGGSCICALPLAHAPGQGCTSVPAQVPRQGGKFPDVKLLFLHGAGSVGSSSSCYHKAVCSCLVLLSHYKNTLPVVFPLTESFKRQGHHCNFSNFLRYF